MTTIDAGTRSEQQAEAAVTKEPGKRRNYWGFLAWVVALLFVSPVLWMVWLSFHTEQDASSNPPKFTAPLTVGGYRDFFSGGAEPVAVAGQLRRGLDRLDHPGAAAGRPGRLRAVHPAGRASGPT